MFVHFVDIGGIVDNHCLNFLFIIKYLVKLTIFTHEMGLNLYMYFKLTTLFQNIESSHRIRQCCPVIGLLIIKGRRGRDRMVVGFTTTKVNPGHGKVYSIQLYIVPVSHTRFSPYSVSPLLPVPSLDNITKSVKRCYLTT